MARRRPHVGANLARAMAGGKLLRPGGTGTKIRNVVTGRVFPCCWSDCEKDASTRYEYHVPHSQPRWRDPVAGKQEMLVYTFCSEAHRALYAAQRADPGAVYHL